jgi:hypothetical protein
LGVEVEAHGLRIGGHGSFPSEGWESVLGLGRARPWVGSSGRRHGLSGRTRGGRGRAGIPRGWARDQRAELGQGSPREGITRRSLALALYAENPPVTYV